MHHQRPTFSEGDVTILCPGDECEDGVLTVRVHPGEATIMYPNDRAYPGAPPSCEIVEQTCLCEPDHQRVLEIAVEEAEEQEQGAYDAAMEAKFDAMREEALY